MALTALTAVGLFGWLITGPKDLSLVRGAMAIATLPMLALMAITFVFPVTGIMGIVISAVFVAVSTAGLLVQLDRVVHTLPTSRWVEGSYQITLGLLVLFWNLLSLLSRRR
jgi:FtsH-binding integral membrane protein